MSSSYVLSLASSFSHVIGKFLLVLSLVSSPNSDVIGEFLLLLLRSSSAVTGDFLLVLWSSSSAVIAPPTMGNWLTSRSDDELTKIVESNNKFTFLFYQSLTKDRHADLVFCPPALQAVLGMLHHGAAGEALTQIEEVLGVSPGEAVEAATKALLHYLQGLKHVTVDIATRMYTPGHVRVGRDFYVSAGKHYNVRIKPCDFYADNGRLRDEINDWVKRATHNRVERIIKRQRVDESTQLLVVNGVHVHCPLAHPFRATHTTSDVFHVSGVERRTVNMMNMEAMLRCGQWQEGGACGVLLPCKCPQLALLLVVPHTVAESPEFEPRLTSLSVLELVRTMVVRRVRVSVPSFTLVDGFDATDQLFDMGVEAPMESRSPGLARVSPTTPTLTLSQLEHKVFFQLAEEAVSTPPPDQDDAVPDASSDTPAVVVVKADRPFVVLVTDVTTGLVLVAGRVTCRDLVDGVRLSATHC